MWKTWCKYNPDYRVIFNLSDDRNNPKNLDICRQHVVFQHFPMQRLVDNPGTWSVNNYKYGQLIALDGNNIDWIYVIKSGEARVFKYLQPDKIDVKARRRKVQNLINSQSPFYRKKRILNFVEEREYIKSAYRPGTYHPPSTASGRHSSRSAPPSTTHRNYPPLFTRSCISLPATRQGTRPMTTRKSSSFAQPERTEIILPRLVLEDDPTQGHSDSEVKATGEEPTPRTAIHEAIEELPEDGCSKATRCTADEEMNNLDSLYPDRNTMTTQTGESQPIEQKSGVPEEGASDTEHSQDFPGKRLMERRISRDMAGGLFEKSTVPGQSGRRQSIFVPPETPLMPDNSGQRRTSILVKPDGGKGGEKGRGRSASFLKTPLPGTGRSVSSSPGAKDRKQVIQVGHHTLPAFVQVETLHPGQVFGLRSCLDPEERGPSVSLVSGECEVLQINKKFFMRHCDDAIYSLIRLKNKPFPTEEDLIDRLDINMQWEEFKQQTLHGFLKECRSAKR